MILDLDGTPHGLRRAPLFAVLALAHCMPVSSSTSPSVGTGEGTTEANVAQYQALEQKLASNATVLVPSSASPSSPAGFANQVFYLEFPADNPTVPSLHRYDDTTHTTVDYTFPIGTTDQDTPYNYSPSATLVTTVDPSGDTPVLTAYSADAASTKVGSLTLPEPPDGEIFQANAVDGGNVYYIDDSADPTLVEWVPPATSTTTLFTFSKLGVDATNAQAFTVTGSTVLLEDEMGGLWSIDLTAKKATSLGNGTQATGGVFNTAGFLYTTDKGPGSGLYYYDFTSRKTTDVAAAILASPYELNATYSMIQDYDSGSAILNGVVYYVGEGFGLYGFALATSTVTPLLLAPQDDWVEYQSPIVLDDGAVFVLGIDTNDPGPGSGTIYRVATGG